VDGAPVVARGPRSVAQNQRGEVREADVVPSLTAGGGGKPGEGYPLVDMGDGVTHTLTTSGSADEDGTGVGVPIVLDTYNQNEVEGEVTNTLARTPTTAVAGGSLRRDGRRAEVAETITKQVGSETTGMFQGAVAEDPGETCDEGDYCAHDPQPDGRRFAACGDGVASPCAHYIGLRLRAAMRGDLAET
jgi:hypothetical protein